MGLAVQQAPAQRIEIGRVLSPVGSGPGTTEAPLLAGAATVPVRTWCEISESTRVHSRFTSRRRILLVCGVFVAAVTLACPRFPPLNLDGKEGVDGSSPSEGFERNYLQIATLLLPGTRTRGHISGATHRDRLRRLLISPGKAEMPS